MNRLVIKNFPFPTLSIIHLTLFTTLFIMGADNQLFWRSFAKRLGLSNLDHWMFFFSVGLAFFLLLHTLLLLVSFRPVFKPFVVLLLLSAAAIGYFSDSFGVVIDRTMIHNIMETDVHEASELLTLSLFIHVFLYGILPAGFVALTPVRYQSGKKEFFTRTGVVFASLILILCLGLSSYKQFVLFGRENRDLQVFLNPSYPVYSLVKVMRQKYAAHADQPLQTIAADATRTAADHRTVVVMVLGETARAKEFAFSGYSRSTNPELEARGDVMYVDVQACGTSTAESLPCIFSALDRKNYKRDKAGRQENVLDILQGVGVRVLWRDNNSGSKGVADRVVYEDLSRANDAELCQSDNCFDEVLLRDLDRRLAETNEDMLVVLHMKGSHGPSYYKRTPPEFKTYLPECSMDNIQDCSQESLVNAYDNTIVYTDYVLAKLIDLLQGQNYPTAMLYVSDHGESLGESGVYLHGLPYALAPEEQTRVPLIFWASDRFVLQNSLAAEALRSLGQAPISHDNIFHSLLGLFDVSSQIYRPDLDILAVSRHQDLSSVARGETRPSEGSTRL